MNMGKSFVTDNRKEYDKIIRAFKSLEKIEATVGLHDDLGVHPGPHNDDKLTYADIGRIQEFGATVIHPDGEPIDIPSRPFTAHSFDKNKTEIMADIQNVHRQIMKGQDAINAIRILAEKHKARQQAVMKAWTEPPNSPRTVKIKGFNDPLVHTGAMIEGVDVKINGK